MPPVTGSSGFRRLSVSVIIPTYNRAALLQTTINSLLAQTRVPDEILVVDDGSTDGTREMLAQYPAPVRVMALPHTGRSSARNAGLRGAVGDLITFLDSDDTMAANSIERRAQRLETSPEIDVVYSDVQLVDDQGSSAGLFSKQRPGPRPSGIILAELALHNFLPIHCAMFRRSALSADISFDETLDYCEDFDFWLRLSTTCRFAYLDEPLVAYRIHATMTTTTEPRRMAEAEVKVQDRVFAMDAFQQLTPREKALIYCSHGIKNAMIGRLLIARRCFFKAVRLAPVYPAGYVLALSSLLGERWLRFVVLARRQAVGNRSWQDIVDQTSANGT